MEGSQHLKILCGGEAWSAELARALLPRCASLWNMYGPTETTVWSSVAKIESGSADRRGPANRQHHVLCLGLILPTDARSECPANCTLAELGWREGIIIGRS